MGGNAVAVAGPSGLQPPYPSAVPLPVAPQAHNRDKFAWVANMVHQTAKLLYVRSLDEYFYKQNGSPLYKRLNEHTLMNWVRGKWTESFGTYTPKDIRDAMEVVRISTTEEVESVNSDYLYISDGLYWSKRKGDIVKETDEPVFYKLFDTDFPDRHTVKVAPFTEEQRAHLMEVYTDVRGQILEGTFKCGYEFVNVWANHDQDIAMDILRMTAYCFLNKKPLGSGLLVGLRRNGKTAYVDMLHTIFGGNNTSRVQLTQLGDPHITHTLRFTLLNAPDEEEDMEIKYQGLFKTMSDHGILTLPVMRSNVPVRVPCDFMSFFPMNHIPEWKGTGASACVSRSLIIPFENDLSKYDKTSKNFCEETFTAEMFSDFLGTIFAFAWYYHRHDHEFSKRMEREQGILQEDLDSAVSYLKKFERFFDGFSNLKLVYEDYQYWCLAEDVKISTFKQFKFVFKNYLDKRTKAYVDNKYVNVYRLFDKTNRRNVFLDDMYLPELGLLKRIHDKRCSVVERLWDLYADEIAGVDSGEEDKQYELFS